MRAGSSHQTFVTQVTPNRPASTRTVVVVDATHRDYLFHHELHGRVGTTIFQPEDRGTAVGVLLALTLCLRWRPTRLSRFRHPITASLTRRDRAVRVQPAVAHDDSGWITPGPSRSSSSLRSVASFVEKPSRDHAAELLAAGAVWNTMVLVAKARAVRDLYAEFFPDHARL